MNKVRILFMPSIDATCTNAQSLNTRELVLRFDPERIESTLWYEQEPDPRLVNRPGIRLLRLPVRRKTVRILREQLAGHDLVAYMDYSPASYVLVHLPVMFRRGTRTVYHAEAPTVQMQGASKWARLFCQGVVPNCDFHTAITDFVGKDLEEQVHVRPSYILPVGVDTDFFSPPPKRNNQKTTVLFVGTLIERKGPQLVLQAAARFPDVRFRIAGSGRDGYEAVLRESVDRLGLRNVELEGPKTQEQILSIMRASDIFLLPSRLEGIPKVTLEAAATGLPCVVFADYQTPSVLHGTTGYQVASVEEMYAVLSELVGNPSLRQQMGTEARRHVAKFDWNEVAGKWAIAYLEMATRR